VASVAHGEVERDAEEFSLVVVGNAAFGTAVVLIAFEPGVETGFFCRLRQVCGTAFELGDLGAGTVEVSGLVGQSRAQLNDAFGGAGYAFAEPQSAREIFFGVVDWLQRLRANAFYVPEMKKLVRGDAGEFRGAGPDRVGTQIDGGGIGVLHAASGGTAG